MSANGKPKWWYNRVGDQTFTVKKITMPVNAKVANLDRTYSQLQLCQYIKVNPGSEYYLYFKSVHSSTMIKSKISAKIGNWTVLTLENYGSNSIMTDHGEFYPPRKDF
jgi:hypothetical protein